MKLLEELSKHKKVNYEKEENEEELPLKFVQLVQPGDEAGRF